MCEDLLWVKACVKNGEKHLPACAYGQISIKVKKNFNELKRNQGNLRNINLKGKSHRFGGTLTVGKKTRVCNRKSVGGLLILLSDEGV